MKSIKLCVIMDPIQSINPKKDTTFALLLEAQKRKWEIAYLEPKNLYQTKNTIYGQVSKITLQNQQSDFVHFVDTTPQEVPLHFFDLILMRKDPPFDLAFLYATYLLELAQNEGCFIVNNPRSLRDANEKLFTLWFPECCPQTLVSSQPQLLKDFLNEYQKIVVKPLNIMGGDAVFALNQNDPNVNVILEFLTHKGTFPIMAQRFLPEINFGDKRILMIDGKPYPHTLSRIPALGDFRGNLVKGAKGELRELTTRDHWICEQVGPTLVAKGLFFVGLDVIGEYLTEVNVTSPTCVREIEAGCKKNICEEILNRLEEKI